MQKQEILDRLKKKLSDLRIELKWHDNVLSHTDMSSFQAAEIADDRESINNDIELFESILEMIK